MKTIKLDAYAKVNLSLDVLRRKEDGYHELAMIMQAISLKDIVTIREVTYHKEIEIRCTDKTLARDERNIAYKAAKLIKDKFNINTGLVIDIEKNIPVSAGLAGGSSNAAAVLRGLNEIWDLGLTQKQLMELGLSLGADVPFCIMGGTALAEGIGEKLTALTPFKDIHLLLVNPNQSVSTAEVYQGLDIKNLKNRPDIELILEAIETRDIRVLSENMKNVLESVTIKRLPIVDSIKGKMLELGAIGTLMSGSGATVFGIFESQEELEICEKEMKKQFEKTIATITI